MTVGFYNCPITEIKASGFNSCNQARDWLFFLVPLSLFRSPAPELANLAGCGPDLPIRVEPE